MVDLVNPSPGRAHDAEQTATAIRNAGLSRGWVVPSGTGVHVQHETAITANALNGHTSTHSATSLTVTIDTGESFLGGAWLARDTTTDVTLGASTAGQTVYLSWNYGSPNSITIGDDAATDAPRIPLHTYDTDGSGVTAYTDERVTERTTDALASAYDSDLNGVVDNAAAVGGLGSGQFLRSDQADTMSGALTMGDVLQMQQNPILGMVVERTTTRPSNPALGRMIYRSDKD